MKTEKLEEKVNLLFKLLIRIESRMVNTGVEHFFDEFREELISAFHLKEPEETIKLVPTIEEVEEAKDVKANKLTLLKKQMKEKTYQPKQKEEIRKNIRELKNEANSLEALANKLKNFDYERINTWLRDVRLYHEFNRKIGVPTLKYYLPIERGLLKFIDQQKVKKQLSHEGIEIVFQPVDEIAFNKMSKLIKVQE